MTARWQMMLIVLLYLSGCGMGETEEADSGSEESTEEVTAEVEEGPAEDSKTQEAPVATEPITPESIIDAVEARSEAHVNYFLHTRVSMEYQDETQVTETKEWFHREGDKDFVRREVQTGDMPVQYYVSDGEESWQYQEGDSVAYVSDVMRGGDMMARPSGLIGNRLRSYQETHETALGEQVEIAGHDGHHITFTPKEGGTAAPALTEMDVYVNIENGLILKEVMMLDGHQMVYELVDFNGEVEHSVDRYEFDVPDDVEVIDMSVPENDEDLDSL